MLTESVLHIVDVLLVIMKILIALVKTVPTNVLLVTLSLYALFVKMLTEECLQLVIVSLDTSMLVLLTVTLVPFNVFLVKPMKKTIMLSVSPVELTDKTMLHIVIVHMELHQMNTEFAITVLTDVKLVKEISLTVHSVKISDLENQNVTALKDIMIMVIILNVKLVKIIAKLVLMVMVVISVKIIENKTHQFVHVQVDPINVVLLVNVVIVMLTVLNVLVNHQTVQFVTHLERMIHHLVHVTIIIMKSKVNVTNVTLDVLLVAVMLMNHFMPVVIVKTNLIDYKTHQFVLVWMVIMKLQTLFVLLVIQNVKLVKPILLTV
jgi:hypothetical protein